jgi:predicted Zn-dependent peptidase
MSNRIRDQMVANLREQESTPDSALESLEDRIIYAGHPYSNDPAGTIATLTSITPAQLRDHHKRSMETSRLLLVVVGDVDAADLKSKVATTFGTLPKGVYKETPMPASILQGHGRCDFEVAADQLASKVILLLRR